MLVKRRISDEGSTLVSVLVVAAVLSILVLTTAAIVVNTTRSLSGTRVTLQAQSAVDAGIAVETARLQSGDLPCADTSGSGLVTDAAGETYTYSLTCADGTATLTTTATIGSSTASRQAVFQYDAAPAQREAALITRAPLDLSALTIKTLDPAVPATVWVVPAAGVSGDFNCNAGGAIAGSVYLPAGTVFGSGGCTVYGDVYAEKSITIGSGTTIHGDLVSLTGDVSITGGNTIDGSIYAKGRVTGSGLSGKFVQSIHAGGNLSLAGGAPVARDRITYGGTFTYAHSSASAWAVNSVTKSIVDPPALPEAPQWEGFTQSDLDALVTGGLFAKVAWTGPCTSTWNHPMKAIIESFTTPTLVDARICGQLGLPIEWQELKLKTDVIFVAPSFGLVGNKFVSADGDAHRVWFIAPETATPNCAAVPPLNVQGAQMLPVGASKISGMIFSPCTVHFANAGEDWQGSVHAGKMTGKPNFWYKPVGFPGQQNPGGGSGGGGAGGTTTFTLVSTKDVPAP
jgi:hypothetical protein